MKTILQLCPRLHTGGIERGTTDVAIALKQAGYKPIVVSGGGQLVQELSTHGIEHITLPIFQKTPRSAWRCVRAVSNLIQVRSVDLIHARSRLPIWISYWANQSHQRPFITSCHSPHSGGPWGLKHVYNNAVTKGNRVIATSQFIANYLQRIHHLDPHKIEVIYRGVDLEKLNPNCISAADKQQFLNKHQLPTHQPLITLPGRITRWKGQDTFVEALAQLQSTDWHAVIVGRVDSASYFEALKQRITQLHLESRISLLPECHELDRLYACSTIALSTSRKPEAFGRVAVESQAMGCMTIATALGAANETVIDQQTGWLIEPDAPDHLAQQIDQVLALDENTRQCIAASARAHVQTHFDRQIMLKKTLAVYDHCMNS